MEGIAAGNTSPLSLVMLLCSRADMEAEVDFEPAALLQELYSLDSVVRSVLSGAWQRCCPCAPLHPALSLVTEPWHAKR